MALTAPGKAASVRAASTSIRVCSAPKCAAIRSEYSNSSPAIPFTVSKPTENVFGRTPWLASRATTKELSRPPDRSTPVGTSATHLRFTANDKPLATNSVQSASLNPASSARSATDNDQYLSCRRVPSGSMIMIVAGGTFRTPLRIVSGAGTTA